MAARAPVGVLVQLQVLPLVEALLVEAVVAEVPQEQQYLLARRPWVRDVHGLSSEVGALRTRRYEALQAISLSRASVAHYCCTSRYC